MRMLGKKESCGENVKCVVMHESHFGHHDMAEKERLDFPSYGLTGQAVTVPDCSAGP